MDKKILLLSPFIFFASFFVGLQLRKFSDSISINPKIGSNTIENNYFVFGDEIRKQKAFIKYYENSTHYKLILFLM